jgi:hypothetical protein
VRRLVRTLAAVGVMVSLMRRVLGETGRDEDSEWDVDRGAVRGGAGQSSRPDLTHPVRDTGQQSAAELGRCHSSRGVGANLHPALPEVDHLTTGQRRLVGRLAEIDEDEGRRRAHPKRLVEAAAPRSRSDEQQSEIVSTHAVRLSRSAWHPLGVGAPSRRQAAVGIVNAMTAAATPEPPDSVNLLCEPCRITLLRPDLLLREFRGARVRSGPEETAQVGVA